MLIFAILIVVALVAAFVYARLHPTSAEAADVAKAETVAKGAINQAAKDVEKAT